MTVLLTGRFEHMRPRIEQILQAHDLEFDFVGRSTTHECGRGSAAADPTRAREARPPRLAGFNHMPDEKTEAAKLAHMTALLQQHRGVRSVNVWYMHRPRVSGPRRQVSDDVPLARCGRAVPLREDREYQLRAFVPWLAARRAERRISRYEAFQVRPLLNSCCCVRQTSNARPSLQCLLRCRCPQVMHGESHLPEAVEQALCAELVRSDHARRREQSLGQPPRALPTIARAVVGVNIAVPPTDAALAQLLAHLHSWPLPSHWTVGPFRLLVRAAPSWCARSPLARSLTVVILSHAGLPLRTQLEHNVPRRSHATLTGQAVTVTLAAYRIGAAGLVAEVRRRRFPNG